MKFMIAIGLLALSVLMSSPVLADDAPLAIGSANFPESQLLATIYAKALSAKGVKVETKFSIGSRETYMPALLDGSITVIPEYAGGLLNYLDKTSTAQTPADVAEALKKALPAGIAMLTPSPAQDADTLVVTKATADKYNLKTLADLKGVSENLVVGASPEWIARREGMLGLKDVYGLKFKSFRPLDVTGPLTLSALLHGQVDLANLTTTNPALARNNLVSLADPLNLIPAQNIVPIYAAQKVDDKAAQILNAISAAMTTDDLVAMNGRLASHDSYDAVASDWLKAHGFI